MAKIYFVSYKEKEDLILEIGKMLSTMRHQTNS